MQVKLYKFSEMFQQDGMYRSEGNFVYGMAFVIKHGQLSLVRYKKASSTEYVEDAFMLNDNIVNNMRYHKCETIADLFKSA